MTIKLIILALTKRWTYIIVGAVLLIAGVVVFAGGHVYKPTEVSGTVSAVHDFTNSDGSYDHSEINLDGDNNTYTFHRNDFTPLVPTSYLHDVHMWVQDPGSTTIIALQYYDDQTPDTEATIYKTAAYNNPTLGVTTAHDTGIGLGVFSLLILAFGLLWSVFPWGKKKQKQPAVAVAGYHAPVGVQTGFPQQPGFPPQGAYPQQPQPGYPPQGAYPPPPPGQGYPPQQSQPMYPPQQPGQGGWNQPPRQ